MLRRPHAGESDGDLLEQQREFEKQLATTQKSHVQEKSPIHPTISHTSITSNYDIIGDIVEKKHDVPDISSSSLSLSTVGFPSVFQINAITQNSPRGQKRKSLFAQKFENNRYDGSEMEIVTEQFKAIIDKSAHSDLYEENTQELMSMSREEILEEKTKLESTLSPTLLKFLKDRGSKRTQSNRKDSEQIPEPTHIEIRTVKQDLDKTVGNRWLELDEIEPEKLLWIGDIPDGTALEPNTPYSARFDFSGSLQPFKCEVDVRQSLHHHGEEPDRPGYTIQELYQLCRSAILQQRNIALTTLGNILSKTKMGYYDSCFDGALLRKLVEYDLFFLLRFAMDDRASAAAAVHCMHQLFVNRSDEICLDRLQNIPGSCVEPYLYIPVEVNKETEEKEEELKDNEITAQDLIRGLLRTDLLVRFAYILHNFDLDIVTIQKVLEIVIRVCRHSPDACQQVLGCDSLVAYVFENLDSQQPHPESVKLLRVIANSVSLNAVLVDKRKSNFNFIFKALDSDEPWFKLKLECLKLWNSMLTRGFLVDSFPPFSSNLQRLLQFYVSTVDVDHGRFDFELFSGLAATVTSISSKTMPDKMFENAFMICIQKWMSQLIGGRQWNFSVAKALACALDYFVVKFKLRGVTPEDRETLSGGFYKIFKAFINSDTFIEMCDKLFAYSCIRNHEFPERDPENLPSLGSVYKNGSDYLKLVQDGSAFPLVHCLVEFLLIDDLFSVVNNLRQSVHDRLHNYYKKIVECEANPSWFARIEVGFLIALLRLMVKLNHVDVLKYGFWLVSQLRTDDERVLIVIDTITSRNDFSEVSHVYKQYLCREFKVDLLHTCDNFSKHWMYEPITVAPKQTVKWLSHMLDNCPELVANVPPTLRYVHICLALLDADNVFNTDICAGLEKCFDDVLEKFNELDLHSIVISGKSFYELYRDLVTEYASSSYGHCLFAKVVTIPLAQKFDISFRKLMWSEFMHALRVITLPANLTNFISIDDFTSPVETDESLLVLYLNAISKNVLMETRNGFLFEVAVCNIRKYLNSSYRDEHLAGILKARTFALTKSDLRSRLLGEQL